MGIYPKGRQPRPSINDPTVRPLRMGVLKAATINLIILQFLFFSLFCYLFGSLYQETTHVHNINVLYVDYDGGAIGDAVRDAYTQLQGPGFLNLIERAPRDYPYPNTLEGTICDIKYWAAFYTSANASDRFAAALAGGSLASSYNRSDVLTMVWNEARYSSVSDSVISDPLRELSEAARIAFTDLGGKQTIQALNTSDPAAISVLSNPWTLTSVDIQPTTQGSRLIYNTLVIILILIQEFFYLGCINGLYLQFRLYTAVSPNRLVVVRMIISAVYTFFGSLGVTGAIWAFQHGWHVNGSQFMLNWMILWLFAHLNFLTLDVFSIWAPPPFVPMALITWIVLNVTSILLPFELSPAFFQVGYIFPAHSVFQVLMDIWSGGCNPQLNYALPVLFAWEILSLAFSSIGVYRRAHFAVIKEEADDKAMQKRIAAAVAAQQKAQLAREELNPEPGPVGTEDEESGRLQRRGTISTLDEKEEMVEIIRGELSRPKSQRRESRHNHGPCFDLPFME
ncbi:hypothetical protein N7486_001813 [Penicillium sp. IBT 16267x]|nr:hypothetical protein N7486_001813 [Penicillium sp. IBT 16267x]